jgi:chromosome segregation protein
MYLKSLTLKGFKSFPERTRLELGPGVSVVVGPNGSGKSNITDAVLWALGEQSPLAVRGQAMQDVIFGGGPGVKARERAEVELVLDNSDRALDLPAGEISIYRRLDRAGEGEYRLCGARCRLVDVLEALSDTGLGKETHSVISQGRIESIVTSRPRERRMVIEEAAGLAKHRKRRRRAQLKLARTQVNLDRALDVEREARSALRPLERQARAAELHDRLERQALEARLELARHAWLGARREHEELRDRATRARAARDAVQADLEAVMEQRSAAERLFAARAEQQERLTRRLYGARSALERLQMRREHMAALAATVRERLARSETEIDAAQDVAEPSTAAGSEAAAGTSRDAEREASLEGRARLLESELARVEERLAQELAAQMHVLERERDQLGAERARLHAELETARGAVAAARRRLEAARSGGPVWEERWRELRRVLAAGARRLLALGREPEREAAVGEVVEEAERLARRAIEDAIGGASAAQAEHERAEQAVRGLEQRVAGLAEHERRNAWLMEQRQSAREHGELAIRRAQLRGELAAERRQLERLEREREERSARIERLRARRAADQALVPSAQRLLAAVERAREAAAAKLGTIEAQAQADRAGTEGIMGELRACAERESEIQAALRSHGETVTDAEVSAGRAGDRVAECVRELETLAGGLQIALDTEELASSAPLAEEELRSLGARLERVQRRREQLGPVNPLAQEEYEAARAHVEELAGQRADLEAALAELRSVIRQADRRIRTTFEATFSAVAEKFGEVIREVFPGGSGRLRLVDDEPPRSAILGDAPLHAGATEHDRAPDAQAPGDAPDEEAAGASEAGVRAAAAEVEMAAAEERLLGVEIEVTPAGKSAKRLSLLSGGEKSMTALAFLFAVFLARPCPFYVLDEVEAALDDVNLQRFLALLRRCAADAQFIVMTHQTRTMEAADWLYGVSMGRDGTSKVVSRRLGASTGAAEAPLRRVRGDEPRSLRPVDDTDEAPVAAVGVLAPPSPPAWGSSD